MFYQVDWFALKKIKEHFNIIQSCNLSQKKNGSLVTVIHEKKNIQHT